MLNVQHDAAYIVLKGSTGFMTVAGRLNGKAEEEEKKKKCWCGLSDDIAC